MSRYWVAGATGFLGSHVVQQLHEASHEVIAVSRTGSQSAGPVEVAAVDVRDEAAVARSAAGCEGAFLTFGKVSRRREDAEELHQLHVIAVRRALAGLAAAGVPRVVLASTSGTIAVGTDPDVVFDETSPAPMRIIARWPYYRTKYYGELEALEANDKGLLEVVIVNPSLLLGPGDQRGSSTGDIKDFLERGVPATPAGGIAFVDVRDAAAGMISAMTLGVGGERYLLNAKNMTVAGFFERLQRLSDVPAPWLKLPKGRALATGINELFNQGLRAIGGVPPVDEITLEMAQHYWYCDATKAEKGLKFAVRDPSETLRDTVRDLVERGAAFPKRSRTSKSAND